MQTLLSLGALSTATAALVTLFSWLHQPVGPLPHPPPPPAQQASAPVLPTPTSDAVRSVGVEARPGSAEAAETRRERVASGGPDDDASEAPSEPSPEEVAHRRQGAVVKQAVQLTRRALAEAVAYARLDRSNELVEQATALAQTDPEEVVTLTARFLEIPQPPADSIRARWLLARAQQALGDNEAALGAWGAVAGTPVDDYATIGQIESLIQVGRGDEAADRALELMAALEDTPWPTRHRAHELRIEALAQARAWDALADEGAAFLDRYPEYPRTDQVLTWLGEAALARGELGQAAELFDQVVFEYPYRPLGHVAWAYLRLLRMGGVEMPHHSLNERFERARWLRINKHWAVADRAFAELLADVVDRQGETAFANEIRFQRAENAYGMADYEAALVHLADIQAQETRGLRSYDVYTLISDSLARLGRYEEGIEALRHRDRGRSEAHRHQELAEFYYENGFFTEALEHYREVYSERRQRGWFFSFLLFLAGEYPDAAEHFADLADRSGQRTRPRYLYWQARALAEAGDVNAAREVFAQVEASWPEGYYGLQASNRLLELNRSDAAALVAGLGEELEVSEPHRVRDTHLSDGDEPSTQALVEQLVWNLNVSLTELVQRRVPEVHPGWSEPHVADFSRPARIHWDGPDGVPDTVLALSAGEHAIDGAFLEAPDPGALQRLADDYGELFPALPRAAFLHSVGMRSQALAESRHASIEFRSLWRAFRHRRPRRNRPIRLDQRLDAHYIDRRADETGFWGIDLDSYRYPVPDSRSEREALGERQVAIYEQREALRDDFLEALMVVGDYHFVRRFTREQGGWEEGGPAGENREAYSRVYPRAYPELVTRAAERWGVNPYIIWALMRVESSYNPDSISRANARGLLQVIPKTGELISHRLGLWDFGPHNLMTPELSVEFGCYYFSELMTKFHGQELLAFAGYNGGPHNVERWLEGRGSLPLDAFVETIPFDQAREYTKKVFRYLALYRAIYLGESSLYVGQDLDPIFEMNIHF